MARVRGHQFNTLGEIKFHHVGFEVANIEEHVQFFQDHLGFKSKEYFQFDDEWVVFLQKNEILIELTKPLNRAINQPEVHIAIRVDNVEELMACFINIEEWERPVLYPNGWKSVFIKVHDNFYIELIEMDE